jgi:hypothetical protein
VPQVDPVDQHLSRGRRVHYLAFLVKVWKDRV